MKKVLLLALMVLCLCPLAYADKEAVKLSGDDQAFPMYDYDPVYGADKYNLYASSIDLADDASQSMLLTVSTDPVFITVGGVAGGDAEIIVYETPTVSTVGTALSVRQLNRPLSTSGTTITASSGAKCSSYGTAIQGSVTSAGPVVLEKFKASTNTQYLIRLENEAGAAKCTSINVKIEDY